MTHPLGNSAAPGISFFTPEQKIPAGAAIATSDPSKPLPKLFTPLKLRGLELQNRIFVSPMCQYSAKDGHHTLWHLTHLGGIIQRGPGLTVVEATAVTPEGRISPEDSGLWKDSQIAPLKLITEFAHSQKQHIAIQLAHAGRKASTVAPWIDRKAAAPKEANGWPGEVISVSDVPYDEHTCIPRTMTLEDIKSFKVSFQAAVQRAIVAGFDAIEIHAAHGYLLHAFLSPATNTLPAPYGGSLENRLRLVLEVVEETRAAIPSTMPLLIRIPGSDWCEHLSTPSWTVDDAVVLGKELAKRGVDLIDVSSAGLISEQQIKASPGYQAPFAKAVKEAVAGTDTFVSTVGIITSGPQAEELLQDGSADAVQVARSILKNPGLVWEWGDALGVEVRSAEQIGWGWGQHPESGIKVGRTLVARG